MFPMLPESLVYSPPGLTAMPAWDDVDALSESEPEEVSQW